MPYLKQIYEWVRLGCLHYTPTYFGTSLPEVTDIRENADGTIIAKNSLPYDLDDGSFRYLGNQILYDGIRDIPEYRYRFDT